MDEYAADVARIRRDGLIGFVHVIEQRCARLLDLATDGAQTDDPRWQLVEWDRGAWAELIKALRAALGEVPPVAQLAMAFQPSPVESSLLMTLWALSTSADLTRRAHNLTLEPGPGFPVRFIVDLTFPDVATQQEGLRALRPQGLLLSQRLLRLVGGTAPADPGRERIELDPDVGAFLRGIWRPPVAAGSAVRGWGSRHFGTVVVAREHQSLLLYLCRELNQQQGRVALQGRPGSGKRTLVRGASQRLQRPLIEVRLGQMATALHHEVLISCRRDARLYQAVLYVELDDAQLSPAVMELFAESPGRLVLGLPVDPPSWQAWSLRDQWPDVIELPMPSIPLEDQPGLWSALVTTLARQPPSQHDLEAHACRPGLVIGDFVRAANTAVAWTSVAEAKLGSPADQAAPEQPRDAHPADTVSAQASEGTALAVSLGRALAYHAGFDLGRLAERLWPAPNGHADNAPETALSAPWQEIADIVGRGHAIADAWGLTVRQAPHPQAVVVHVEGGGPGRVAACAGALARVVGLPLYRVDLAYVYAMEHLRVGWYLDHLFAAAARCCAVLLVAPMAELTPSYPDRRVVADALAIHLERAPVPVLLHSEQPKPLPLALSSRIERTISLGLSDADQA